MTKLRTLELSYLALTRGSQQGIVRKTGVAQMACMVFVFCAVAAIAAPAQTVSTVYTFSGPDGELPQGLIQGTDGNYYGVTFYGGAANSSCSGGAGCGTAFKITPGGTRTTLYSFCSKTKCADGFFPVGTLVQGADGNFYGVTSDNGIGNPGCQAECGTVFKLTPGGGLTTLHTFNGIDGSAPNGGLVQDSYGYFYGTTAGTVFRISPTGYFTTLYKGVAFPLAGLVRDEDGLMYGTTQNGGTDTSCKDCGTVFAIRSSGAITMLHSFSGPDGIAPQAALMQANDGNLYGTTSAGGAAWPSGGGTVFRMAPGGHLVTLASLPTSSGDPDHTRAPLVEGTDGNFYGAALTDGASICCGFLFKMMPEGTLTTLVDLSIPGTTTGPVGLFQATNGLFYGTNEGGRPCEDCNFDYGTVYSVDVGLGPFVSPQHNSGEVGFTVRILGQGLTGTTAVSFNGTPASFTVVSDTYLTAIVPAGATTGFISVTTPTGTLKSNRKFWVNLYRG
jgi:uncharacterized repeat protein (TIGR03803 family)